jgi:hypothetical protein
VKADQLTHPEPYIRARALQLFADQGTGANQEIERLIEGTAAMDELDLLGQQRIHLNTRHLLAYFLAPCWFRTDPVLAHARMFYADYVPTDGNLEATFIEEISKAHQTVQDYYCYVLLDFVAVDRDLEETPLAAALVLSDRLGFEKRFAQIAVRELGLSKKRFATIERDAAKIVERANASISAS